MPLHLTDLRQSRSRFLFSLFSYVITYGIWVLAIRLLTLTFITYFIISPTSRFQDISDAFSSNEVSLMGLSAFLYVALLYGFNPLTATPLSEIITRERIEKGFLPGFVQGSFFAGGLILAFVLSGLYRYLGYFIQLDEAPLELINVFLRMATLGTFVYCEEFLFRHKFPRSLEGLLPNGVSIHLIAICYCGIKLLQFDLGIMQVVTLYLVSIALSYRALTYHELSGPTLADGERPDGTGNEEQFALGAGFWAAILIVFQPLLSLPIFGNDFSGILFIKYQAAKNSAISHSTQGLSTWSRILSGGAGGPLSSFAIQALLLLDIGRSILRRKKLMKGIRTNI